MTITVSQHLAALALVLLDMLARGVRIRVLLPGAVPQALAINTCGDALAAVTPARLGGEPLRFLAFQRSGATAPAILAAFVTEAAVDMILAVVIGLMLAAGLAGAAEIGLAHLLLSVVSATGLRLTFIALVGIALGALAAVALRRRWRARLIPGARDAWQILSTRSRWVLARVVGLAFLSLAARGAVLPVLAAGAVGVPLGTLLSGSLGLSVMQTLLPIPSGLGPVDLGFAVWFSSTLSGGEIARLLVLWRLYTIALGAAHCCIVETY
jgi:uncharacterized membrane protein YbhN (UPF0104 family)